MSLLMKALQQAAKNRGEGGGAGDGTTGPAGDAPARSDLELELEPMAESPGARRPDAASRRKAHVGPDIAEPLEDTTFDTASPARAAAMLAAGGEPPRAGGPVEYIRNHPLVAISTVAGLFMIGYGVYVYLQLTNPGLFQQRPAPAPARPVVTAPPAQPPAPAPGPAPAPAQQASGTVATASAPGTPPGPSVAATTPAPGAAGAPAPASAPSALPPGPAPVLASGQAMPGPAPAAPATGMAPALATVLPGSDATTYKGGTTPPRPSSRPAAEQPAPGYVAAAPEAPRPTTRPEARPPAPAVRPAPPRGEEPLAVNRGAAPPVVNPLLVDAHRALEAARFGEARELYQRVLTGDATNIDALLGLASIALQERRPDEAGAYYGRVLELDPRNAHAQAGLIGQMGRTDPAGAESRLKQLIAREPSAFLHFTLGNLYADQGQWAQAQSAYFQAVAMQPDNPDYAFNLAVGLERLSQPKLALAHYRKALSLARERGHANFDIKLAQARAAKLEAAVTE